MGVYTAQRKVIVPADITFKQLHKIIQSVFEIIYCYDFGDNWQHQITMHEVLTDYDKNYPVCLEGVGNAPPEDIGGVPGYEEFFKGISDPKHPAYDEVKNFASEQSYKKFDINLVNEKLKYALRG